MPHRLSRIHPGHPVPALGGIVALLLAVASPALANSDGAFSARFPVPKSILALDESDATTAPEPQEAAEELDAVLYEPDLKALVIQLPPTKTARPVGRAVPVSVIREGFSTQRNAAVASPERSVGLRLGADTFSISTKLIAPPGQEQGRDARIDWRLARPVANSGQGFIWTVSTGGGSGTAGRLEQNANLLVGFRHQLFEHLTLTSQVAMGGSYVFAPDGGAHSTLVPEVKLTANLAALAALPWDASLDLALARQMPLVASAFETRGTAMFRLKYSLD